VVDYAKFSDFADPRDGFPLEGSKRKLGEILNLDILVTAYRVCPSKKNDGKCLTIQFDTGEGKQVCFTGSGVLINQLERYKDKLPFMARITKIDKYFTLS
jgi:hypothetical protein